MDLNLPKAATAAVDEAAIKLDPVLKAAIQEALTGLSGLLDDRTITFTIHIGAKP